VATRFGISGDVVQAARLDLVLTQPPFALSRREAKRRLAAGDVVVDGRPVSVASREIAAGAHVSLLAPGSILRVIHLDRSVVVVDKPDALPTQPSPGSSNPSLLEVLAATLKRSGEAPDLFIVHRLDTNTTGVVAMARSKHAADEVSRLIVSSAEKRYLAICDGRIAEPMEIDSPIARLSGNQFGIDPSGKPAKTLVEPLSIGDRASLLDVRLETGRTHQIRVHLASIGHAVVGDRRYGSPSTSGLTVRPMLHARRLDLPVFGTFEAPPPDDFVEACAAFGLSIARQAMSGRSAGN
jgi:23S rRNA pseudouridine1911/1915/1917 synthase